MELGHWLDDGTSCTTSELLVIVRANLDYLEKDDPCYAEQKELEQELLDILAR